MFKTVQNWILFSRKKSSKKTQNPIEQKRIEINVPNTHPKHPISISWCYVVHLNAAENIQNKGHPFKKKGGT